MFDCINCVSKNLVLFIFFLMKMDCFVLTVLFVDGAKRPNNDHASLVEKLTHSL